MEALIAVLVVVLPAVIGGGITLQVKRMDRRNTEQHDLGALERAETENRILEHLRLQDETRGHQVDSLHTALGRLHGTLDAHIVEDETFQSSIASYLERRAHPEGGPV